MFLIELAKVKTKFECDQISFFSHSSVDPVTNMIEITVHYFNQEFDVQFWSQYVSFVLIGIIVITSIRGLLITLTKVDETRISFDLKINNISLISFSILYQVHAHRMSSFFVLHN